MNEIERKSFWDEIKNLKPNKIDIVEDEVKTIQTTNVKNLNEEESQSV